ncbi:hypothetical protein AVEN_257771-1 [Araneus ventricosus]|uniref:Uncharacterized protein n=1 Tax=Araneus ventricosus TaxID=182803 RepID=A0A4Y2KD39_ARAVE|nr:hypothetical protein AVEN_257771-1 [Araneus ventricosus]
MCISVFVLSIVMSRTEITKILIQSTRSPTEGKTMFEDHLTWNRSSGILWGLLLQDAGYFGQIRLKAIQTHTFTDNGRHKHRDTHETYGNAKNRSCSDYISQLSG